MVRLQPTGCYALRYWLLSGPLCGGCLHLLFAGDTTPWLRCALNGWLPSLPRARPSMRTAVLGAACLLRV